MSDRTIIVEQMKRKIVEIQSLEEKLKAARIYVRALEDVLKVIERGELDAVDGGEPALRKGSWATGARDVILRQGRPVHIDELLAALGKDVTRETKASLTGSLAAYVRKAEVFSRPAPNTYGLIELGHVEAEIDAQSAEPPPGFGATPPRDLDDEIPF